MQLSVVIPALNEADGIALAVTRALALNPLEVIVADGGSADETAQRAVKAGASVVHAPRGRAKQQNVGASAAAGDVLLFLHADSWLAPAGRGQIARTLASPNIPGGCFYHRFETSNAYFRLLEIADAMRVCCLRIGYGDQGIFVRRAVFERLGGFPDVALMEDVLLMRRLRNIGRIAFLRGPLYTSPRRHLHRGPLRQTLRNWCLITAEQLGVAPDQLARLYR